MPEIKVEIKSYRVSYLCEKCTYGDLVFTGLVQLTDPPFYEHLCNHCGNHEAFLKKYPAIVYSNEELS